MKEELREKTRRKVSRNAAQRVLKILKLGILAFIISLVPLAPAPHYGVRSSFANFPEEHAEFLSSGSYEALFGLGAVGTLSASGTSTATGWSEGLVVGTNVRVNALQAPFAAGLLGRSETTIAASPDGEDIVVGWNDAQGFCGVPFGAACTPQVPNGLSGFGFSTDGGLTWTDGGAPDPALGFSSGLGVPVFTRGDPWLAADEDGDTFFYANLAVHAVTGADLGVSVHRGEFDGDSFAWNDVRVFNSPNAPNDFYDKEAIATDPNDADNAAVSLTNFIELCGEPAFGFGQIELWRTNDGGDTWVGPTIVGPDLTFITDPANPLCGETGTLQQSSVPAFGPDGEIFVVWQVGPTFSPATSLDADIVVAVSLDGGATFGAPVKVADINSMRQNPPVGYNRDRINDHPRLAVITEGENEGRVLVAFYSSVASVASASIAPCPAPVTGFCRGQTLTSSQVFVSFSDDQGETFGAPVPVAPAPPSTGLKRWWPVVTVGEDGAVNMVYYESNESPVPSGAVCQVNVAGAGASILRRRGLAHSLVNTKIVHSDDGGETFGAPVTVSTATSDWCAGTVNIRPNFGDYIGATTARDDGDDLVLATWADSRETILIGGVPRNVVDVFFAPVRVED